MLSTPHPSATHDDLIWTSHRLANGIQLTHVPSRDNRFYLNFMFRCGSRCEAPEENGLSHFLEHMMFRGSRNYPSFLELAEAFDWLGGEWNAATGHESTEYWYSGHLRSASQVLPLFYEFLQNPLFLDLEAEREVILREREDELNELGLYLDSGFHMYRMMWPNNSLAHSIIGEEDTIRSFSREDLLDYRNRHYQPNNMAICIVGNIAPNILEMSKELFAKYDVGRDARDPSPILSPELYKGPKITCIENSDNQFRVQLSFACQGDKSPHAMAFHLLARILADGFCGSLSRRLREELSLVYDVSADAVLMEDVGSLDIEAAVSVERFVEYLENLCDVIVNLVIRGPQQRDLERATSRALTDLDLLPTVPESVGSRCAWRSLVQRSPHLAEDRSYLKTANRESIARVARQLFSLDHLGLVIIGPKSADRSEQAMAIIKRQFAALSAS